MVELLDASGPLGNLRLHVRETRLGGEELPSHLVERMIRFFALFFGKPVKPRRFFCQRIGLVGGPCFTLNIGREAEPALNALDVIQGQQGFHFLVRSQPAEQETNIQRLIVSITVFEV
ncbi:MAG: hypothetical protein IID32_09505, partial [Planctomycetes bacterium]|nr:hypothetical protein [Planctomycetota bacterium]